MSSTWIITTTKKLKSNNRATTANTVNSSGQCGSDNPAEVIKLWKKLTHQQTS